MDFHTGKKVLNISGPQIRRIRNSRFWSQPELAAKCQLAGWDVSRDIIARIECRSRWVGDFELAMLARVLGVSVQELLPVIKNTKTSAKVILNKVPYLPEEVPSLRVAEAPLPSPLRSSPPRSSGKGR